MCIFSLNLALGLYFMGAKIGLYVFCVPVVEGSMYIRLILLQFSLGQRGVGRIIICFKQGVCIFGSAFERGGMYFLPEFSRGYVFFVRVFNRACILNARNHEGMYFFCSYSEGVVFMLCIYVTWGGMYLTTTIRHQY